MRRAVALSYEPDRDLAPVVLSSGEADVAEHIERAARAHAVAIVRDGPLARALCNLPVGEPIPEGLYEAVAAILREIASESCAR